MTAKAGIAPERVTPRFILTQVEPIEQVYADCEDELLLTIARYFREGGGNTPSAQWRIATLARMGKFTKESAAIIARYAGYAEGLADIAVEQTMLAAVRTVEPAMAKAYAQGLLREAPPVEASDAMKIAMAMYRRQAADSLNLVNTVMLNSSLEQYRRTAANTLAYEERLSAAQAALNRRTGEIVTGQSSLPQARAKAVRDMARAGLTGFVDRAGRAWTPEAYVSMDMRTTLANTAHAAVEARMRDWGVSIFQVSEHAGARPLCYPYQGKYYSTDGTGGTARDLHGKEIHYEPLGVTSYGQAAGLFGINCGHRKIPFIPGYSVARRRDPEPKAENDRQYRAMQHQRQLERAVRAAKREAACLDAVGDKEGFRAAAMTVKQRQAALRTFVTENGLTKRADRTQVLGYNQSVSGKATQAARQQRLLDAVRKVAPNGELHRPPKAVDVDALSFDDAHINGQRGHGISESQAKAYIREAKLSVSVWNGKYERYYASDGAAYVDTHSGSIRTAYSRAEFDEKTEHMMREAEGHGQGS